MQVATLMWAADEKHGITRYSGLGKTFVGFILTRTSCVYIGTQNNTYKISRENFCGLQKILYFSL